MISLICFTLRPEPPPSESIQATSEISQLTQVTFAEKNTDKCAESKELLVQRKHHTTTINDLDSQQFLTTEEVPFPENRSTNVEIITVSALADNEEFSNEAEQLTTLETPINVS